MNGTNLPDDERLLYRVTVNCTRHDLDTILEELDIEADDIEYYNSDKDKWYPADW